MLQQFTWQHFLIAASTLTLIWYIGVVLLFYRKELTDFIQGQNKKTPSAAPLAHTWENEFDDMTETDDLMGKSILPEGLSTVSMNEFGFAKDGNSKEMQLGLADILEELKGTFNILATEDGSKKDFFSLLALIKSKYPKINSNPNLRSINAFIAENAPFLLTEEELENLWD